MAVNLVEMLGLQDLVRMNKRQVSSLHWFAMTYRSLV